MNNKKVILILLFTLFADYAAVAGSPAVATADQSTVMTERGPVKGIVTPTLRKFPGIPYAAAPVGKLRWRPPKDHVRWFTPLDTTRFGSHCSQVASIFGTESVREDCLFLNIFTSNDEAKDESSSHRDPVMVWIHGGAMTLGKSHDYIPAPGPACNEMNPW